MALAYYYKGFVENTIQLFEKAIELNPHNSEAYSNLGVAYGSKGNLHSNILENHVKIDEYSRDKNARLYFYPKLRL